MPPRTAALPHMGRKIERLRTLKGIKQDTLAATLGISQGQLSKIEQSAKIDDARLEAIAGALEMTPEAIKAFDESGIVNLINNMHDNKFDNHAIAFIYNQFNPIEKISELYERLLAAEKEKNALLKELLKAKK